MVLTDKRTIYDISRTISPATPVWPGDTPFSASQVSDLGAGGAVNLFTLTLSAHTGTHADAPFHYAQDGAHPAALPLEKYIGPAHVVTVARESGPITPADLAGHDLAGLERLLIHTWASDLDDDAWPDDFPHPTVELIDWLAGHGCVLLGVDMPSVDAFESKDLACHHRLKHHDMLNLEMLCLRGVPDGVYQLVAVPLKLEGVCASPVRAVLIG
jgi:arylformamidase